MQVIDCELSAVVRSFRDAVAGAGLTPPEVIHADGQLHRFATNGKRSDAAGWYCLHGDNLPAGAFGDWRQGVSHTWCSKDNATMTASEREAYRQRMQQIQAQRDADQAQRHESARDRAGSMWSESVPAGEHSYLTAKGVPGYGLRQSGDVLLVPLRDVSGTLHSLQTIDASGQKRFLSGGKAKGCYHSIGTPDGCIVVCEGFATGASIHAATGQAVACAMNAGNLQTVAQALHAKYPALKILIAADDDYATEGNPGMAAARQAALSVGGMVAVPLFDSNRPAKATDFNDLHQAQGLEAVKACIASAQAVTESDWPQPQPLPQSLPEVQPFDADLLPDALRAWVADVAFRMQQPPDFAAAGAIVALSSLVGVRAAIHPKQHDDWLVIPNLWGMLIGRPSAGKSPALNAVTGPLRRLEAHERTRWQEAYSDWELDCKVAGLVEQANEKQAAKVAAKDAAQARRLLEAAEKPEAPVMRRFVVNDSTVEKLGELLRDAPFGLLAYRDELYGLLASMDKQGNEESRAFYLQAYDGNQGFTFDRIIRGETHIPRVCLALLGGIQPARLQEYVRSAVSGGAGDDGLLQRFGVAVWPDMRGDFKLIDQWPDTPARQTANDVFDRLSALEADGDDPKVYRFDSDAQRAFNEWYTAHMQELRSGELHPALESHLGKYPTLIPSLALLFALIDAPDCEAVGLVAFMRAQSWGEYLRSHAMRIYSAASRPDTGAAHALLNKVKQGKVPDGFRLKDVKQNGWAWLDTTEAVKRAVSILEDYGWIRGEVKPTTEKGGRPGESYALHPSLKKDYRL